MATNARINGWDIHSIYEDDILTARWFVNDDWYVFIKREHHNNSDTYYYRAAIEILGQTITAAEACDDSPLEAFRWAREELQAVSEKLDTLRRTAHYATRKHNRLSHKRHTSITQASHKHHSI